MCSPPLGVFSEKNSIPFNRLNKPRRAMNSTYSSLRSQNDINNVIGHDIILSFTVAEANNVNYIQFLLMS